MTGFQAPKGTRDLLAPDSTRLAGLVGCFADLARRYAYGLVVSPMFEDAQVFRRGVGESSEVVAKEMYEFEDKGGRMLALRPEGTAPVVRAYLQHRPPVPFKAWYVTPAFRYEAPQAGRYRQHHQVGAEAIGSADADLDVEVIALAAAYFSGVGLREVALSVNSMGDGTCRPGYVVALGAWLEVHAGELCAEHRARFRANPLRVLDCKKPECTAVRAGAPRLSAYLCDACAAHLRRVTDGLDALGVVWQRDDFLVRGLDYYTRTTFEFASLALDAAQNAVGGGGRYDGLAELLGGPATPGIGFASGLERVLLALEAEGTEAALEILEVFVVDVTDGSAARDLTALLRGAGISADRAFDQRSMKSQLKLADRSGARVAVLVGPGEASAGEVTLRQLRGGAGEHHEERVATNALVARLKEVLS